MKYQECIGEMPDVIGIGHCAVDFLGLVPYYPSLDEKIRITELRRQGGGEVATALVTLSRLGATTSFIGKIGDDDLGNFILTEFKKEKIDISHIIVEKGASSLCAFCIIDKVSGKRTIFWYKDMKPLKKEELDKEFILSGKILLVDYHEPEAAIIAAEWFKRVGKTVVLDIDTINPQLERLVKSVDVVIGSEIFARNFAIDDYFSAAEKVASLGPRIVVFTLGEKGCLCYTKEDKFIQPAFEVNVVDTTGCGDVFHGAFVYGLLRGWNLRKIAIFSNAVAAMKCTKIGGRAGIPSIKEVEGFLKSAKMRE
jgi:ribokinase